MRKLYLLAGILGFFALIGVAQAAPQANIFRNILPETNNTYDIGSSSPANLFRNLFVTNASSTNLTVTSQANTGGCAYFDANGDLLGGTTCSGGSGGGATTTINSLKPATGAFLFQSGNPSLMVSSTSPGTITLTVATATVQSLISGTSPVNVASGVVSLQSNFGSQGIFTSGYLNASSSQFSNSTTTGQFFLSGLIGKLLATDNNGMVVATTSASVGGSVTSVTGSGNISSSGGATPNITLNSNVLGITLFSGTTLNASSTNVINATTSGQTFLTQPVAGHVLALDANGMVIATTTQFITLSNISATAPIVDTSGVISIQSNLGANNYFTSGYLNASTTLTTSATTTNLDLTGIAGKFLAVSPSGLVIATSSPVISLANGTNTTAASNQINLNANVLGVTLFSGTTVSATTANFSNAVVTGTTTTSNLLVGASYFGSPFGSTTPIAIQGNNNNYLEVNLQNQAGGTGASSDYVLTSNNGTATNNYSDFFYNNSGYTQVSTISGKSYDAGLLNSDGSLILGTASTSNASALLRMVVQNINIATGTTAGFTFNDASATQFAITGILGKYIATDMNGMVIATTVPSASGLSTIGGGASSTVAVWTNSANTLTQGSLLDNGSTAAWGSRSATTDFNIQGSAGSTNALFNVASSSASSYLSVLSSGNVGINTSTPTTALDVHGQAYGEFYQIGTTSTATLTVNFNNGNTQSTVLATSTTVSFSNATSNPGTTLKLFLVQDGGSRTVTWSTTNPPIVWAGGTTPTLSTATGTIDIINFICMPVQCYGVSATGFGSTTKALLVP